MTTARQPYPVGPHEPFSVAVTIRGSVEDLDKLRDAVWNKLDDPSITNTMDAAQLLAELYSFTDTPGVEIIEHEASHSGESDVGIKGEGE